jgi:hypothetical protein
VCSPLCTGLPYRCIGLEIAEKPGPLTGRGLYLSFGLGTISNECQGSKNRGVQDTGKIGHAIGISGD